MGKVVRAFLSLRPPTLAQTAVQLRQPLSALFEDEARTFADKSLAQVLPRHTPMSMPVLQTAQQRSAQFVQVLESIIEHAPRMDAGQSIVQDTEVIMGLVNPIDDQLFQAVASLRDHAPARERAFSNDLRRGTRRCGAQIRDKIADGKINLMSHRR